jgi:hypothetical protein
MSNARYYQEQEQQPNVWSDQQSQQPAQQGYYAHEDQPPPQPPRPARSDTNNILPQGQDRAEQLETMQSYEAAAPQSEDDKNQQLLQKEFPKIDGSLIAAIYGDSKSLSATREMLMELNEGAEANQ